jgi:hypothetical protein
MSSIIELQRKLQDNMDRIEASKRGIPETQPPYLMGNYRLRTAARNDASKLLQSGKFTPQDIADALNMPIKDVLEERKLIEMRKRYLSTGSLELPDSIAHFSILQK